MNKPSGWDDTNVKTCENAEPPAGGHVFKIMGVKSENVNNIDRLTVKFDIAEKGIFENYYNNLSMASPFDKLIRKVFTAEHLEYWKGFTTSVERSNEGYVWEWDEKTLLFKFIGGNLRYAEYKNKSGEIVLIPTIEHCCSVQTVLDKKVKPLPVKKLR